MNKWVPILIIGFALMAISVGWRLWIIEQIWGIRNEPRLLFDHYTSSGECVFVGFPYVHVLGLLGFSLVGLSIWRGSPTRETEFE